MKMRGKQANTVGRRFKGFYAFVTLIVLVSNFILPIHQLVLYAAETSPTTEPTAATTANDKVTISNVKFDKSTVYEDYGLNIVVSFDWEGKGLQKGDTLITPMSEAFDSITKIVNYKFSDGSGNELGTMTLDYNRREIRTTYTADMDPRRIYSGTIRIGTYINRNFFTELDSTKTIRIPIPHGDPIEIPLRVKFESYIPGYDIGKTYVNAVEQTLSKDQTHAEVLWHGLVNVKHLTMKDLALYASPKLIERVKPVGSMPTGEAAKPENRVELVYNTTQSHPFTMDPDSFGVFEAETTYDSMGYVKGKRLEYGKDYEMIPGIPGDENGYIFHLIGDYATTDKSIIMEGKALYDNLPVDSTEVGESQETFVTGNAAISFFDNYGNLQTGDYNAVVYVTDSDVTNISVNEENKETGSVTVIYVTDTGKTLAQEEYVQKDQPLGTPYQTEKKTFEGYVFKKMAENSASPTGEVTSGRKTVIYVYTQEQKGNVDVKYIDLYTGNELTTKAVEPDADDVYRDGKVRELFAEPQTVGTPYETIEHHFKGYRFVRMGNLSAEPSGVVTTEEKHVIYMYEPIVKGIVDVTYIDIDTGQPISVLSNETKKDGTTRLVTEGDVGAKYATIEETFPGYTFVRMGVNSAPATGEVLEKIDQHVIYAYRKTGSVDVKYVDEQGKELPGGEVTSVKTNAPVGESYMTEEKTFAGYTFKGMDKTSSPTEGKVTEGTQHVIYVYSKNPDPEAPKVGSVDVKYVDEQGKELPGGEVTSIKTNAPVGESYKTEEKTFTGYTFKGMDKTSSPTEGKVIEGTQHVIYVYSKNPDPEAPKVGSVDVVYLAEDGTILKATKVIADKQPVDTPYQTETLDFEGYSFQRMGAASANPTGKVTEAMQHVVYIYRKNPVPVYGNVDVTHKLTDGTILVPTQKVSEQDLEVGTEYATEELKDAQYRFVGMDQNSDAASGIVSEGMKHVIYLYEKVETPVPPTGSVDVIYVAENGKILESATMIQENAQIGTNYQTTQKEFAGYEYVRMGTYSAAPTGKVIEGLQHVIYIYREVEAPKFGSITVKYVDKNGQELPGGQESFVAKDEEIGTEYVTEEKQFDGYHFLGMDKNSYPATGIVTEGIKHVIYVYEKEEDPVIPEVKYGDVDVTYVDEQGNPLPGGETITIKKHVPVGESYETDQKYFPGYSFKGMSAKSATANGKVVEGELHVIYVYTKDEVKPDPEPTPEPTPTPDPTPIVHYGSVDVTYVAESGASLPGGKTMLVKEHVPVGTEYSTAQKEFEGYTFKGMDPNSAPGKGKVVEGVTHVIYIYQKVAPNEEEHKGSVDVTYVDESGNPIPGGQTTIVKDNVPVGEKYTTDEKNFDGYVLVGLQKDSAPAKGTVIEGEQHVIYVYKKNNVNHPTPSKVTPPTINNRGNVTVKTTPSKVVSTRNDRQLPKTGSQAVNPIVAICYLMMSIVVGIVTMMVNKKSQGKY